MSSVSRNIQFTPQVSRIVNLFKTKVSDSASSDYNETGLQNCCWRLYLQVMMNTRLVEQKTCAIF